jgi:hypothetical protein
VSVEVLKPKSVLIKLSPELEGSKTIQDLEFLLVTFIFTFVFAQQLPEVLTSYFYFYVRFCAATAVVDGGDIFEIWRVGEKIWVRFFWAKGLGGS